MTVQRFMAPGPWITRDLKECVRASDYDALAARLAAAELLSDARKAAATMYAARLAEAERQRDYWEMMYKLQRTHNTARAADSAPEVKP